MRACQAPAFSQAIVAELKLISLVWLGNKFWIVQTWLENVPLSKTQWCWLPVRGLNEILFVLWNLVQSVSGVCWWSIAWRDFMCFFFLFLPLFQCIVHAKITTAKSELQIARRMKMNRWRHPSSAAPLCLLDFSAGGNGKISACGPPQKNLTHAQRTERLPWQHVEPILDIFISSLGHNDTKAWSVVAASWFAELVYKLA